MKNHGKVYSLTRPNDIEMNETSVFVASNIEEYNKTVDDYHLTGYEYNCTEYTKDEYLTLQSNKIASLEQELAAAKILLGVD